MGGCGRRASVAATVVAGAMGLVLALPVEPAGAMGTMTAKLSIRSIPEHICGNLTCAARWDLTVEATVPLSPGEVPNVTDHKIVMRLWGDDPSSDDLIQGPSDIPYRQPTSSAPTADCSSNAYAARHFYRTPGALRIRGCFRTSKMFRALNEDDSVFDDWDEIYVGVRLVNPQGATVRLAETNRLTGKY